MDAGLGWGWVHASTRGWDGVGIMITVTGGVGNFFFKFSGVGMRLGINCAGTVGMGINW